MDNKVTYKIDAIDKITPVYRTLIGLQNKAARSVTQTNSGINEANRSMNQLANTTSQAGARITNATRYGVLRFQRVRRTVEDTNTAVRRTGSSMDWLRNRVQGVERRATMMGNRMRGVFNGVTNTLGPMGTAVAGILSFEVVKLAFDNLTNRASDLNESANKAQVVFGKNFGQIQKLAKDSATALGLSTEETYNFSSSLGGLFKTLGHSSEKSTSLSQDFLKLASDMASFSNTSVAEAVEALQSGFKGESEPLMKYNVMINDARLKQQAFDMGITKSTKGPLTDYQKSFARMGIILKDTADAQGDWGKTNMEVAGRTKTLTSTLINMQANLGQKLLPLKLKFINLLVNAVGWIDRNANSIIHWGEQAVYLGGALIGVFAAAKTIIGIANMYRTVSTAVTLLRNSTILAKVATIAFNIVANMSPFGWIALAIGGIILLVKHWDKVKVYLARFAEWVWKNHPFRWMIDLIDRVFPGFKNHLAAMFESVKKVFLDVVGWIYDNVLKPLFGWLGDLLDIPVSFDVKKPDVPNANGMAQPFMPNVAANSTLTWAKGLIKKDDKPADKSIYNDILSGYDPLKDPAAKDPTKKDPGGVKDSMEGLVSGGGKEMKNINIRIDKLIESFTVSTETFGLSANQIKSEVQKILLSAVNEVNYQ